LKRWGLWMLLNSSLNGRRIVGRRIRNIRSWVGVLLLYCGKSRSLADVMGDVGMWTLENAGPQLEGISMAIFTRFHGWTKEDVETFVVDVRKEMRDTRIHIYWPIYVVYGKKPEAS